MDQKLSLKLCPVCDGQVDINFQTCPYCGSDFSMIKTDYMQSTSIPSKQEQSSLTPSETIASLYPPPYRPKIEDNDLDIDDEFLQDNNEESSITEEEDNEKKTSVVLPTLIFSLGVNLLLIAIFIFAFAKNGRLTLSWPEKYWLIYFLVSLPLIFFGIKRMPKNN
jgi:hypothetical protein